MASETDQSYLEEDLEFFDGLEHNVESKLPVKVKQKLKSHFKSLKKEYETPTLQLTLLHPYLSYLGSPDGNTQNNNCLLGFADTQSAVSTAFVYDTIPFIKTLDRMTNPCFMTMNVPKS